MARDTKILQSLVDGQHQIRQDIKQLEKKVDGGFEKVNGRIDNLGMQLANLEDDAPTKLEHPQFASG